MEKKVTTSAIKGVIISLVLIVFSLVVQFLNLNKNKAIGSISVIIFIGALIWAATSFANQMDNNVTFGNVFTHTFKTAAAVTAIMVVYTILSIKFINPETMDMAMQEARTAMEAKNMSDEQIDQAIGFTKKFFVPLTTGGILLVYLLTGVVASLIGAAVAKKNPQSPFAQQG